MSQRGSARDPALNDPLAFERGTSQNLKRRSVRGAAMTAAGQATKFAIRFGTIAVLARLIPPEHFGLVGMTVVFTGFVSMFADAGLSSATIQREQITQRQISTLFWINVAIGFLLCAVAAGLAEPIARFYGEPRLRPICLALALTFVLGGFGIQHQALLRRQMRFRALASVEVSSMLVGSAVGIILAWQDAGYWALVGMTLGATFAHAGLVWLASSWRPSWSADVQEAKPLLRFGGDVLTFNVVNYFARQADTLLVGWSWGPVALALYDKAYTLLLMPIKQVNGPLSAVAVPALSRSQGEHAQFARYFLGIVEMVASLCLPLVLGIALFADEIVRIWLGPRWAECADLFRLLAVAAAIGAINNPLGWLLISTGRTQRFRQLGVVNSSLIVLAFVLGLPHGARGVALAYSIATGVLMLPTWWFATHGTPVQLLNVARRIAPPLLACLPAAGVALLVQRMNFGHASVWLTPLLAGLSFAATYVIMLLFVLRQWRFFREIVAQFRRAPVTPTQ